MKNHTRYDSVELRLQNSEQYLERVAESYKSNDNNTI